MRAFKFKGHTGIEYLFVEIERDKGRSYGIVLINDFGEKSVRTTNNVTADLEKLCKELDDIDLYSVIENAIEKANANED